MSRPRPLVIAHRGASGLRPEHSRAAYELAVEHGADAIEPDLVLSRDGELVLRHENEISGTTDVSEHPGLADRIRTREVDGVRQTGWFTEDLDWAELAALTCRERLPALRPASAAHDGEQPVLRLADLLDILDAAPREVALVAELKHATHFAALGLDLPQRFADAVRGWAGAASMVVESFELHALQRMRELDVPGRRVFLAEAEGAPADLVAAGDGRGYADLLTADGLAGLAEDGVDGVSVDKAMLLSDDGVALAARVHDAGLALFTWTLRPENAFLDPRFRAPDAEDAASGDWRAETAAIRAVGVDGVFADRPDLVARLFAAGD